MRALPPGTPGVTPFSLGVGRGGLGMRPRLILPATLGTFTVGLVLALAAQSAEQRPCDKIIHACKQAGFVEGDYKKGYGLWIDYFSSIMRGTNQPRLRARPLAQVSP